MATAAHPPALAAQARRSYVEGLIKGLPAVVKAVEDGARLVLTQPAETPLLMRRRDAVEGLQKASAGWLRETLAQLRGAQSSGMVSATRQGDLPPPSMLQGGLSLVDNNTIETEILSSRLALAMMDSASWEFTDLRSRMAQLEGQGELPPNDVLRPHVLSRILIGAWTAAGLDHDAWRLLQSVLHEEFAHFAEECYHEVNRWLIERNVLPEVDLRPFIRRSRSGQRVVAGALPQRNARPAAPEPPSTVSMDEPDSVSPAASSVAEETRMMTRPNSLSRAGDHAEAVLGRLNRLVGRQLPDFVDTVKSRPDPSASLRGAIDVAQRGVLQRASIFDAAGADVPRGDAVAAANASMPVLLEDLHQRKQALKQAAASPVERATIEIVALLFQSILTEERIPATVRVWFARLQMPVLRVAVSEPDFFATTDHPARRLIDRMGTCVMGFDAAAQQSDDVLEKEIKRVVQVVEAYPDTGRRVFQTVLTEFEKFLERYFEQENAATKKGVSLAQQVEQRETLAIQYTIELRKMLNEVPVQEGVREFLFHTWADVLATTAIRFGAQSDETKAMKRAAADLIWSASAKVSREERTEVLRRLPLLLKVLRDGMQHAGIAAAKQEENIQHLNGSLAAAFTAKAAAIPGHRLEELMARLETLEEMLPDADDVEIDETLVLDLSGHESSELEVVGEGGSMPTPAMLSWARELQVGSWYMLDYRSRNEAMQLVWRGMRKQLTLFVSPQGRGVLFQQHRLAAFLQSGLLVPAQDESLTVRATRSALAKLDADPSRLLN